MVENKLVEQIKQISLPLRNSHDLDPLLKLVGKNKYVLLGEASHGTHEYYTWRTEISKRLIVEKEFSFIAVEGDWPDCYKVNRYIKGYADSGKNAYEVLFKSFKRWPTWMWANAEIAEFVEWLKAYNKKQPDDKKVGFYGLDIYSLWDSLKAIIDYLKKRDPQAVDIARNAYLCFEPYRNNEEKYAMVTSFISENCSDEVLNLLIKMGEERLKNLENGEETFSAEQNALVVKNAEKYYRTMLGTNSESWNIRDRHMAGTLNRLVAFYGKKAKAIAWAHNTHVGDARYTDMKDFAMVNIGQLIREEHSEEGVTIAGFSSYKGTAIAGSAWGAPKEIMKVPQAQKGSWEDILHKAESNNKLIILKNIKEKEFFDYRGQRAIGVVYDPLNEIGNYVPTILPKRYDALLYIDKSKALRPILVPYPEYDEVPETFPSAV